MNITPQTIGLGMAIIVQVVGLGIALGALRQTVRSLREIADATIARLDEIERRLRHSEDRTTRLETKCELHHGKE